MGLFSESITSRLSFYFGVAVLLAILGLFGWFAYRYHEQAKAAIETRQKSDETANRGPNKQPATLYFFFTTWCGACTKAKPVWDKFVSARENKSDVGNYEVSFVAFNCDNTDTPEVQQMMTKHDVHGFPTVRLVAKDISITLDGAVQKNNLERLLGQLK